MARCVGYHEGALLGREKAIGDVDRDALLALRLQPVEQQGEVDAALDGAEAPRVFFQGRDLVLEQAGGVVDQPADERRLAVIDRPAGQEA